MAKTGVGGGKEGKVGRGRWSPPDSELPPGPTLWGELTPEFGLPPASTRSPHVPLKCRRPAQGLRRGHNIWTGSQPPSLEGAELGAMLQLGQFKGPRQRKLGEIRARRRGGGAQATTAPQGRGGSRGKPILAPARVGTWNPQPASSRARTGYPFVFPGEREGPSTHLFGETHGRCALLSPRVAPSPAAALRVALQV